MCDAFNFFLSSSRIYIECAFGELVRRWGIFWRTLNFDLAKSQKIVQVRMLLHNFIKSEGNNDTDDSDWRPRDCSNAASSERPFPQLPRGRRALSVESI